LKKVWKNAQNVIHENTRVKLATETQTIEGAQPHPLCHSDNQQRSEMLLLQSLHCTDSPLLWRGGALLNVLCGGPAGSSQDQTQGEREGVVWLKCFLLG